VTGGAGRRRASRIPAAIRRPPATWIAVIDSESRMTAKITATNGCRLAASVARAAPIR